MWKQVWRWTIANNHGHARVDFSRIDMVPAGGAWEKQTPRFPPQVNEIRRERACSTLLLARKVCLTWMAADRPG